MVVGWMEVTLRIEGSFSLKDKRKIVKHLLDVIRVRLHLAVGETNDQELHNLATLGFSVVSNNALHASEVLDKTMEVILSDPRIEVEDFQREVQHV